MSQVEVSAVAEKLGLTDEERRAANSLVLLNADLLKAQYSTSEGIAAEGETLAGNGNKIVASNRFASACKLALYEGNTGSAKKYLERAVAMDTSSPSLGVALSRFDSVSKCVVEFYRSKSS